MVTHPSPPPPLLHPLSTPPSPPPPLLPSMRAEDSRLLFQPGSAGMVAVVVEAFRFYIYLYLSSSPLPFT